MILAGIDEAGYGPILGPMTVGCCALRIDDCDEALPDVWARLKRLISIKRDATGRRLHVADSKQVYSPSTGLRELEKSVLALAAQRGPAGSLDALLDLVARESIGPLARHAHYAAAEGETFPIVVPAASQSIAANVARVELAAAGVAVAHLHAFVLPESQLNELFARLRNKAATSFNFVARHLATLLERFDDEPLTVVCDRQGGRSNYAMLLRQMFEEWSLAVVEETDVRSSYELSRGGRVARLIFAEKSESLCASVAIASMLAKYLREATMGRFNAWFAARVPNLKPTAGYWTDGLRFLDDVEPHLASLGLTRAMLARER